MGNLKCLCRQHHRLKTFHSGWQDTQLLDGTVIWTSPTGRTYRTSPAGADLFPPSRARMRRADTQQAQQAEAAKLSNYAGAQA
ncbi:13E12 repeat-containing protein [Mycobacterium numidiamassiliense]|uniref:13E12 repeat-containing protein n=1 Tax=Mycobacterium numidiamassiliense TaxID=1841861 RepID=A0A2U3P8H5_9MYCO|nr:13E12 repeat-containing protein [Mycobacterium numidiamassiliense]